MTGPDINDRLDAAGFQTGVGRWMDACFGPEISSDRLERGDRFLEEALELTQAVPHFTKSRAHALVDYVFSRPVGDIRQEVGGVMVTLAALCNTFRHSIGYAATRELHRVWDKVEAIRTKQQAKPTGSALPQAADVIRYFDPEDPELLPEGWFVREMGEEVKPIVYARDSHVNTGNGWYCNLQHRNGGRLTCAYGATPAQAFFNACAKVCKRYKEGYWID